MELVQPFKLALLKLASQEAARLMAAGEYELALPVALDAVQQGQALFKPAPALQLFPLYLLAAQANLGLRRAKQCEDFLALASWLAMKEPGLTTSVMKSQLSRLYGQLYAFTSKHAEALAAFAEDVYYCSLEYGPEDVRTSLGYYNMGKVFQASGDLDKAASCNDQVVAIWAAALNAVVLGLQPQPDRPGAPSGAPSLPVGRLQLMEVVDMLSDIARSRAAALGAGHVTVGEAHLVTALALLQLEERTRAGEELEAAAATFGSDDTERMRLVEMARMALRAMG
ncbi:FAP146 protein [Gonium pectorale]|uniref:FAP146 protein n=1 Tax=Gonium pectorale TaxID=33097 RepID=A0A150H587_GONPE|nr:FAP146 protein [Gonium pectorale]|eukprot:KXZ56998.1 FAP146 protein [Gonium pectorale]